MDFDIISKAFMDKIKRDGKMTNKELIKYCKHKHYEGETSEEQLKLGQIYGWDGQRAFWLEDLVMHLWREKIIEPLITRKEEQDVLDFRKRNAPIDEWEGYHFIFDNIYWQLTSKGEKFIPRNISFPSSFF